MTQKPTYEELEQRIKELNREIATHKRTESERLSHLRLLEIMDKIDQVIRGADDIRKIMSDVLETVLTIFQCDRVWLIYPCDPEADFWRVPMECTRPEYPGAFVLNQDIPMTSEMVESFKAVLKSKDPLVFHPEHGLPLPDSSKQFSIQSSIASALYPRVDKPWMWGLSQCSHARQWTEAEISIFQEIGRRISDSLSILLTFRNLKESEEKYRSMMDSMKASVYICSPDFRVEYMNPAMIKRTGVDATGEVCHKAIHDLDEQCPGCVHDKIQQGESVETEILSPNDNRYYNVSHSPIFHQDGSISKMTIYRDMTESKTAEQERVRLATAIEQASESVIISDRPGTIQYVNPAFEQLSGFNREEVIGQNFRILKSDKHHESFYREMYGIISRGHTWAGRIINTMKDGTLREFETRISPVKDSSGEIINFVSVNRDVTQVKTLESQLQHAQRMDAIGTLAGGVAHDFNNILSSVIGFTELALDDAEKGTLQYENLQEVLTAGSRAKDLVQQILTFSRQSDQEQKPVIVQVIAKEALKMLRASTPSTIEIKQNIQSESLVMGDSTQIHQVFMNLCTNAAHAMDDKGGVLTVDLVDIKLDSEFISDYPDLKPGAYINLTVTDTGYGMTPDVLDKTFDPFFTTKDKGKGAGMGLSVVHGIVHSHGGGIYVYSEPGKGSTFRVFLPVLKRRLESEERIEKPIPTGTERILFVDDELSIVNIGKQTLGSLGYDVVTRTSSIEALEFFKTQPDNVDIVITDLTMPNMTGEELAKELMQIRPDIPIILCTGFSARMDEKKAMEMGIRAFVSKPILKREIAETIRKVIDSL
jgi:PAS domain S-box-containing protein